MSQESEREREQPRKKSVFLLLFHYFWLIEQKINSNMCA